MHRSLRLRVRCPGKGAEIAGEVFISLAIDIYIRPGTRFHQLRVISQKDAPINLNYVLRISARKSIRRTNRRIRSNTEQSSENESGLPIKRDARHYRTRTMSGKTPPPVELEEPSSSNQEDDALVMRRGDREFSETE